MRYGVLSDVHGNLHALEATLTVLDRHGVDAFLCLGDVVGYGAFPNECVDRILALPGTCIAGNHDLMALGRLSEAACNRLAREAMVWTRRSLRPETKNKLANLPLTARTSDGLLLAHGSLDDAEQYVATVARATEEITRLARRDPTAKALILGHTHSPMAVDETGLCLSDGRPGRIALPHGRRLLLNPGAVGQAREGRPLARSAILDLDRRCAEFYGVSYDIAAARDSLRRHGLPVGSYHIKRSERWRRLTLRVPRRRNHNR